MKRKGRNEGEVKKRKEGVMGQEDEGKLRK